MRAGAVKPESAKPVKSANGGAGGGAVRGAPLARSGEVAKTTISRGTRGSSAHKGGEVSKTVKTAQGKGGEVARTVQSDEIVQSSESKSGTLKTEVNGSVQTNRQKHIGKAKTLKTMSVRYAEVVKTKHSRSAQRGGQKSTSRAEALKTAQDKGSEITETAPTGGAEFVKTEISKGVQMSGSSKIVNAKAHPIPAKSARIPAKNKTAPQRGAKQRGRLPAPAPAFPRRRLTSSEVKQLVDRAMEKLKEERPADYALLYELYFNRVSLRSLSRTLRIPRSTLRYRKRLALARIKQIIETLPKQF